MIAQIQLQLSPSLYLRDPQSSDLGQRIIKESILLMDECGFEAFNFKKLSQAINSTEASIYRYFENKHRLLLYLIAWYWNYLQYKIEYETHNISSTKEKLSISIKLLTHKLQDDDLFAEVSESALQRVVIQESDKTYLTKNVDFDNKVGLFRSYQALCETIANFVKIINPSFEYPYSLVSTCLEAAHQQIFFAEHLPKLSDIDNNGDVFTQNQNFISTLIFNAISQ